MKSIVRVAMLVIVTLSLQGCFFDIGDSVANEIIAAIAVIFATVTIPTGVGVALWILIILAA